MFQMFRGRSKATRLRHRRVLLGQELGGSPEPRGRSGTLGPPRHSIWVERGHVVLYEDQKKPSSNEEDPCLGRGLGTPVSSRPFC